MNTCQRCHTNPARRKYCDPCKPLALREGCRDRARRFREARRNPKPVKVSRPWDTRRAEIFDKYGVR